METGTGTETGIETEMTEIGIAPGAKMNHPVEMIRHSRSLHLLDTWRWYFECGTKKTPLPPRVEPRRAERCTIAYSSRGAEPRERERDREKKYQHSWQEQRHAGGKDDKRGNSIFIFCHNFCAVDR